LGIGRAFDKVGQTTSAMAAYRQRSPGFLKWLSNRYRQETPRRKNHHQDTKDTKKCLRASRRGSRAIFLFVLFVSLWFIFSALVLLASWRFLFFPPLWTAA
jgi:hypothetical protein